jgi:hypothetical protein
VPLFSSQRKGSDLRELALWKKMVGTVKVESVKVESAMLESAV